MALTAVQLANALRLDPNNTAELDQVTRLGKFADTEIARIAPAAPDTAKDEAKIRVVGYLYDLPTVSPLHQANAFRNSGALGLLLPYRKQSAGAVGAEGSEDNMANGTPGQSPDLTALTARVAALEAAQANFRSVPGGGASDQALAKQADNSSYTWRAVSTLIANASITVGMLGAQLVARLLPTGVATGKILQKGGGTTWNAVDLPASSLPTVSASDNGQILKVVAGAWAKAAETGGATFDPAGVWDAIFTACGRELSRTFVSSLTTDESEAITSVDNTASYGVQDFLGIDRDSDASLIDSVAAGDFIMLSVGTKYLVAEVAGVNMASGSDSDVREIWYHPAYCPWPAWTNIFRLEPARARSGFSGYCSVRTRRPRTLVQGNTATAPAGSVAVEGNELKEWSLSDMRAHVLGPDVEALPLTGSYATLNNVPAVGGKVYVNPASAGADRQLNITWANAQDEAHLVKFLTLEQRLIFKHAGGQFEFELTGLATKNTIANGGIQTSGTVTGTVPASGTALTTIEIEGTVAHLADIEKRLVPKAAAANNGKIAEIVSGAWSLVDKPAGGGGNDVDFSGQDNAYIWAATYPGGNTTPTAIPANAVQGWPEVELTGLADNTDYYLWVAQPSAANAIRMVLSQNAGDIDAVYGWNTTYRGQIFSVGGTSYNLYRTGLQYGRNLKGKFFLYRSGSPIDDRPVGPGLVGVQLRGGQYPHDQEHGHHRRADGQEG